MKIFISYRRDDSAGYAGRVHDRLAQEFGRDLLFMDVDAIPLGVDFVKVLRKEVAKCDVLVAVIGPRWIDACDENGKRRLESTTDFVRVEIATALQRDVPVIPILLDGASIPKSEQLPKNLEELARRNGLDVRHASFHKDMDRLIAALRRHAGEEKVGRRAGEAEVRQRAQGQNDLGVNYRDGRAGLPQDDREAARLFKLAADQGNSDAQANLGLFYQEGRGGLPKDDREAARLYKLAADQGNADAQYHLGYFYENSRGGLPKDDREAGRLYRLAADQKNSAGALKLWTFYQMGLGGLPKDEREAARFKELALSWLADP